ncbi:hypothetical protein [Mycolicibacterium obuense]|uniref:Uncharacterized protein n=1 Tax=Mycolicibacterium obuense TaxID=1807 RepID=A0A0J6YJ09_9MYCO|nr:hypothetical protein [Mycolicibacterium obuense]KMO72851.1 hypothetical protein MOBUDSM44075_03945 [Mycolicibacterium obuense]
MTVPADGVPRLMHFVDARLAQLRMSKDEAHRRGFPHPSTLKAARARGSQRTPTVRTLLRIDRTLGWQPGSAAVVLLGGAPQSVTRRITRNVRAQEQTATPMTAEDIADRLLGQLRDEIERARSDVRAFDERLTRLHTVHERLAQELRVDHTLVQEFDDQDAVTQSGQH